MRPAKPPKWYDPNRPLITFRGGPREREWSYLDRWLGQRELAKIAGETKASGRTLGYTATDEIVEHPRDDRVTGAVWVWYTLDSPASPMR